MKIKDQKTRELYKEILDELGVIIKGSEFENHVYTVGGCERDMLLGLPVKDIDLVVDLPNGGINFAKWLYENGHLTHEPVVYENYGTAMFCLKSHHDFELEAVQTRKESYRDMTTRNPETAFGTIHDDCKRRDFTINALYRNVSTGMLHDFTEMGLKDLESHIIRSCDDPDIIFKEDPLRILRAIRFEAKLGADWSIDLRTRSGILANTHRIEIVSRERITDEFDKILFCKGAMSGLLKLKRFGIMKFVSTELDKFDIEQLAGVVHGLRYTNDDKIEKLSVLFLNTENPAQALQEMKYPNHIIDDVMTTIHEIPVVQSFGDSFKNIDRVAIRKQQARVKDPKLLYHIVMATHSINNKETTIIRKNMQAIHVLSASIDEVRRHTDCFSINLPVNGEDIMDFKGIEPGPKVKLYLNSIREEYFKNPKITRNACFKLLDFLEF